jgi:hypothetical protein
LPETIGAPPDLDACTPSLEFHVGTLAGEILSPLFFSVHPI